MSAVTFDNIPAELRALKCWHAHIDKSPRDSNGARLSAWQQPEHCLTFEDAVARATALEESNAAEGTLIGVGIAYSASGDVRGLDLDGPRHPTTGIVAPDAQSIITAVDSYTEV